MRVMRAVRWRLRPSVIGGEGGGDGGWVPFGGGEAEGKPDGGYREPCGALVAGYGPEGEGGQQGQGGGYDEDRLVDEAGKGYAGGEPEGGEGEGGSAEEERLDEVGGSGSARYPHPRPIAQSLHE